jgi:hypothetical protein
MAAALPALIALGPVGWAALGVGIVGGAVLGSELGPNWGPASNYPDRSNTVPYGTFVSDVNGAPGQFNGQTIQPGAQYSTAIGNESGSEQMYAYLSNPGNYQNVTGQDLQYIQQLQALSGGSPTGLGIASEYNGMFTLGSGQKISVSQYTTLFQEVQAIQQNTANTAAALAPLMSIQAFGAGNSYTADPYNVPGMQQNELGAEISAKFASYPSTMSGQTTTTPASAYSTPGVGTGNTVSTLPYLQSSANTQSTLQVTIPVNLDGQTITNVVNSYNIQSSYLNGTAPA